MINFKILTAGFIVVSLITACGGGGGGSAGAISGVAFDGYLYKAKACLDKNDNLTCDANEPFTFTDENGKFTLTGVTPEESKAHSIVVMAIKGTTIDQDNPGITISHSYFLTAPAGTTTVSPLTTLVKAEMLNGNLSQEDAENKLKPILGNMSLSIDAWVNSFLLSMDYTLYYNSTDVKKIGTSLVYLITSIDIFDFANVLTKSFAENIVPNSAAILQATTPNAAQAVVDSAVASNLSIGGINELRYLGGSWFGVRSTSFNEDSKVFSFTDYWAVNETNFHSQSVPARDYWELTNSTWQPVSSILTQGLAIDDLSGGQYGNTGVKVGVEFTRLEGTSFDFSKVNRSGISHTFPAASTSYKLSFTGLAERYILSGVAQGSLQDLNALVAAYPSSAQPSWVNFVRSDTGLLFTFTPTSASAGTLSFRNPDVPGQVALTGGAYSITTVSGQQILLISQIPEAALTAVAITNPTALHDYNSGVRPFFAVDPNGSVREGVYTPAGKITNPTIQFNGTALNSVLKALSLCQLSNTYTNVSCPN